jgi:hypothetical protein
MKIQTARLFCIHVAVMGANGKTKESGRPRRKEYQKNHGN